MDWRACCTLLANILLPSLFGWTQSYHEKKQWFQNRLKLSIKPKLWTLQAEHCQVLGLSSLLKRAVPWPSVRMGPEIKMNFPQQFKRLKRMLKSFLSAQRNHKPHRSSRCAGRIQFMDDGRDCDSPGSFFVMTGTVAPGKQCVTALQKRMFWVIESPPIREVGEKMGRGDEKIVVCGWRAHDLHLGVKVEQWTQVLDSVGVLL